MGGWLARLKNEKAPNTHATKPTKPAQGDAKAGFVGFVAYPTACFQKIGAVKPQAPAANDGAITDSAPTTDPDRWCWPTSPAMNSGEIDTFTARLQRFTDKGVSYDDAERLADKLVIRDRESDDRRLCLECAHLQGAVRWRCGYWQTADVARDGLARELVLMLQRCGGFRTTHTDKERMMANIEVESRIHPRNQGANLERRAAGAPVREIEPLRHAP